MNIAMHPRPRVEIEDDVVRLQRRKLEYETGAPRRTGSDRRRTTLGELFGMPAGAGADNSRSGRERVLWGGAAEWIVVRAD